MRKGFTLVELSIVLVIIGLLIGGVLKGKAMIESTKVKKVKTDVDSIVSAMYSFQDKYGYFPGDYNGTINSVVGVGNGNGIIDTDAEELGAWNHLAAAGIISGKSNETNLALASKKSPFGKAFGIQGTTGGKPSVISTDLPNEVIEQLDKANDDGVYNTGDINSTSAYTVTGSDATMKWKAF